MVVIPKRFPLGRVLMYSLLLALALFVLLVTFLAERGGGSTSTVAQVSIRSLRSAPQIYDGQTVTTDGVLSFSQEHGLYQIADDSNQAVLIRKYRDEEALKALSGQRVRATGQFGSNAEDGIYIDADVVQAAGGASVSPR